jgi:uncharacterized membrane protein YphA (DoxX/SURF4 family)
LIDLLFIAAAAYLALGLLFAVPFVLKGVGKIDRSAQAGTWGFRILILPGTVLLWPLLAKRWGTGATAPLESTPHKRLLSGAGARSGQGADA